MFRSAMTLAAALMLAATVGVSSAQASPPHTNGTGSGSLPPLKIWSPENTSGGIATDEVGCAAEQLQSMLGHPVELAEAQPGLMNVCIFTPEMAFGTMDHVPHRLNIRSNAEGVIEAVYCG